MLKIPYGFLRQAPRSFSTKVSPKVLKTTINKDSLN